MSLLSKLFGGGSAPKAEAKPESHQGYSIFAEPIKEASGYRVSARIEKEIDGETRSHQLIRADICNSADQAAEISVAKARQMIDEQGDRLFG